MSVAIKPQSINVCKVKTKMLTISQSLGLVNDIHRLNVGQVKVDGFQLGMKSKYMASWLALEIHSHKYWNN